MCQHLVPCTECGVNGVQSQITANIQTFDSDNVRYIAPSSQFFFFNIFTPTPLYYSPEIS